MRTPLIAGNWKMNGSAALVEEFGQRFAEKTLPASLDVVVLPPFPIWTRPGAPSMARRSAWGRKP